MEIISSKIPSGAKSGEGNTCTKSILKQLTFQLFFVKELATLLSMCVVQTLDSASFSERLRQLTTVVEFMQSFKTKFSDDRYCIFLVPDL